MLSSQWLRRSLVAAFSLLLVACGGSSGPAGTTTEDVGSGALLGEGSSFDKNLFNTAFFQYSQIHNQVTVNYPGNGSGAGIKAIKAGTVDFGATDVPMGAQDLADTPDKTLEDYVQIPVLLGVAAVTYNLPSVKTLKLDGPTLSDIFLGNVKTWSDPKIAALNPGVTLPTTDISVHHRSDASGTTYAFTDYLSTQSSDWKASKTPSNWAPGSSGDPQNDGVAKGVQGKEGAIGYVELDYAKKNNMQIASLKNKDGQFLQASTAGATAAASQAKDISSASFHIVNEPGKDSYPIATFSWVVLVKNQDKAKDPTHAKASVNLFKWLVTDGQKYSSSGDLQYAPLPQSLRDQAIASLKTITASGKPVLS